MPSDIQSRIIRFLSENGQCHEAQGEARIVQTHISIVVLKGQRAWKLKRAVHLPYADFSTPGLRYAACQRELELNRRTAPSLYRAARRVTQETDGRLVFDGDGEMVDAVVEMARFDEDTLFSRLAKNGGLTRPLLTMLARDIAQFHKRAEQRPGNGAANIEAVLTLNERSTEIETLLGETRVARMRAVLREGLEHHTSRLAARGEAGRIRLCHGDLHLGNLCLVDGRPTLFDCIEFNDTLATIDVLYDLAFLLMDLWQAGLREEANWVMNRYIDESDDNDSLCLLPYFMALRASIRAQVISTQALTAEADQQAGLARDAEDYLELTLQLLAPHPHRMLAIGGLSGSGKSTVAANIAHRVGAAPGARVLSSDRIRKWLAGVSPETRLPPGHYTMETSKRVYAALYEQASASLKAGHSVIADAVFSKPAERHAIEHCAVAAEVPFQGFWLKTSSRTLISRVQSRRDDPSDATADVVQAQLERDVGPLTWRIISSELSPKQLVDSLSLNLSPHHE